ncbi:MAG: DUF882 domain-containing protein [Bacteriovoracaceae bacterium]|nr:DUF882 domain-containing protein [Bacteriovoracaceae bacterium]
MTQRLVVILLLGCFFQTPAFSKVILKSGKATVETKTGDKTSCFPGKLNKILLKISRHFGKPVHIVSGYRSPEDNARRGGAKSSMHIKCKAADFRVPGVSTKSVGRYLARMKERGGAGFYCRGRFHVDVGTRRHWGGCVSSFINFDDPSMVTNEHVDPNYLGELILEEEDHADHEDENDYDEARYYNESYDI